MHYVDIGRDVFVSAIFYIAVARLFRNARKRCNYLFREYWSTYLFQGIIILVASVLILSVNILRNVDGYTAPEEEKEYRILRCYLLAAALVLIPFMISLLQTRDNFRLFNRFPEQVERVSIMQYTKLSDCHPGQAKNGSNDVNSAILAERMISNSMVIR